uniref:TlpA family protein disulfide reductase n=1 Tax=candidate division WOR-3 bacterium TaxID=2052148 RepID=A0A7C4Y6W0_UNCW3
MNMILFLLSYDFKITNINDSTLFLSDLYREKPVLISFWATWCKPCKKELKFIQEFYENYSDSGIYIITISVDDIRMKEKIKNFVKGKKFTFPVFFDTEKEILKSLGISSIPATIIVNKEGDVEYKHIGFKIGDEKDIEDEIKRRIKND